MSIKKRMIQIGIFLAIMLLTFYALFHGQNLNEIAEAAGRLSIICVICAVFLGIFFVSAEGFMIWYLLRLMERDQKRDDKTTLLRCIQYSFIGFFYSGITPSATGGQPVQLYYMNRDGHRGADSTVVLMTVALVYKFVLVLIGFGILIFWLNPLKSELGRFFPLYVVGLLLNTLLVCLIFGIMIFPEIIQKASGILEKLLIRIHLLKPSEKRQEKIQRFIDSYRQAVLWLKLHRNKIVFIIAATCLQRSSVFLLTYVIYLGFGLKGHGIAEIMMLQASIYIAVDMLPLPGSQGITELMYQTVFSNVFAGAYLIPSMMINRGINFYFLLIISLIIVLIAKISEYVKRKTE